ncbi:hypothetical protein CANINC_005001 [Pichia inconspicua]|uniref:Knr4/Smi1-like domain-containing protein n=1 Tax=Pichia inconspicua TaxID=52247 RepID=A0A4T0WUF6_9ASCO|nr:hypothetical protein CANINC_005001 [[Candida] inconspicua]
MSFFKNIKEFFHNVTTQDHYAQYDAPSSSHGSNTNRTRGGSPLQGLGVSRQNHSGSQVSLPNNVSTVSLTGSSHSVGNNRSSTTIPYRPGMRSQLNNDSQIELRNYENGQPVRDMTEIWDRIDDWLDKEFPELGDDLQSGATANDLNAFENDLNINLPSAFRDSYQIHDGQVSMGKTRGLIFTYQLMDLEAIAAETNIWRKVYAKYEQKQPDLVFQTFGVQRSCPPKFVLETYYDPLWIPFVKDNVGNNIAIDLNPAENGKWGQVILFGRDYNVKYVVADSFSEFLSTLSDELENGFYEIDEDEDLNYIYKGRAYNYFEVLRLKSINRAKKLDPNFTLEEGKLNDADLLVKKNRSSKISHAKKSTLPTPTSASAQGSTKTSVRPSPALSRNTKTGHEENEHFTRETIIAPVYPTKNERDFTPSKENIATNDSFVIDEDVSDVEEETLIQPAPVDDVVKGLEDVAIESEEKDELVTTEEAKGDSIQSAEETAEEVVEAIEAAQEEVAAKAVQEEVAESEIPAEVADTTEEPVEALEAVKPAEAAEVAPVDAEVDTESVEKPEAEVEAEVEEESELNATTEAEASTETAPSKKKKNKKKKGKK